jgi:hypothetical protein
MLGHKRLKFGKDKKKIRKRMLLLENEKEKYGKSFIK